MRDSRLIEADTVFRMAEMVRADLVLLHEIEDRARRELHKAQASHHADPSFLKGVRLETARAKHDVIWRKLNERMKDEDFFLRLLQTFGAKESFNPFVKTITHSSPNDRYLILGSLFFVDTQTARLAPTGVNPVLVWDGEACVRGVCWHEDYVAYDVFNIVHEIRTHHRLDYDTWSSERV